MNATIQQLKKDIKKMDQFFNNCGIKRKVVFSRPMLKTKGIKLRENQRK